MDHLLGNSRYHIRDHGNRGNIGAPCALAPSLAVVVTSWHCASRAGSRATEFTDHRHRPSVVPVLLLHRPNWPTGRQSSAVAGRGESDAGVSAPGYNVSFARMMSAALHGLS